MPSNPLISAERYHDISCGHRVVGHEGKCRFLHGHNYRVHFSVVAEELDKVGRVMDFTCIKEKLCMWLETEWDHKFLVWDQDPELVRLSALVETWDPSTTAPNTPGSVEILFQDSFVWVPFNPTAENMAQYLLDYVGPTALYGTGVRLQGVRIEETRKCSVNATI